MNNKVEILAPAGDLKRGMIALAFGADAIYFGAKAYSLRARASNFDFTDVKQMCTYAHKLGKRAYLVTNILCHCHHLPQFSTFLTNIIFADVDGYICSDPFIIQTIKEKLPQKEIHISTQLSVTNSKAALFYKNNGATRIIVSRELAINELKEMIANVQNQIAIEYFVHGAVCIACSGRCMLSSNYCLRDANVGGCAQSCRWPCLLYDQKHTYSTNFSMSAKDMCLISDLQALMLADVSAFKIEGRMKSEHYIATVVNAYKHVKNSIVHNQPADHKYVDDVVKAANRQVSCGWFNGLPSAQQMLFHGRLEQVNQNYVMLVQKRIDSHTYVVLSKNYFNIANNFEILSQSSDCFKIIKLHKITLQDGSTTTIVNTPMQEITISIDQCVNLLPNDMLRLVC